MKTKKWLSGGFRFQGFWLVITLLLLSAGSVRGQEITVSAAISLKEAFVAVGKAFEGDQKKTQVRFNFGASGDLVRQIIGGAPVDVFASADLKEMDELEQKGFVVSGTRVNFAANTVVLAVLAASKLSWESFGDLRRQGVKKIAIGNPATVPAGRYAKQVLEKLNLWDSVKEKLVLAENVRQVLDYVARNEVDAGLVYATDAASRSKELKKPLPAPEGSHAPVVYPLAAVTGGKNEALARAFIARVLSEEGKRILGRYGFQNPGK